MSLSKAKKTHLESFEKKTVKREYWGQENIKLPELNLTQLAINSYNSFLHNEIWEFIKELNPIDDFSGKNWRLEFLSYRIGENKKNILECFNKGLTYDMPLFVKARLINKRLNKTQEQEVFIGDVPKMTNNGTFIINGIERVVINQLVRSPGVFFTGEVAENAGKTLYGAEIRPIRGCWLEFFVSKNETVMVKIDRKRKFPVTTLIRALDIGASSDEEILAIFNEAGQFIVNTLKKDETKGTTDALLEIYRKMRPGEPLVVENAQSFFNNLFFNPRRYDLGAVGRYKINKRLNKKIPVTPENYVLLKEDIIDTIKQLIMLQQGKGRVDDIDHLGNRRIRMVGELVGQLAFRPGLLRLERMIKEKMSMLDTELVMPPGSLINAKPVLALINEFFRTSQLSSILDQTNPLSEIDNLRRLTVMGVGGINRDRASFSIRDINHSQFSRICPVRSPEGPNIGLVTYLALYTRVNEYGFLEAPYCRVIKENGKMKISDNVIYLTADDEEEYYITHSQIGIDDENCLTDDRVPARYRGEFIEVEKEKIQLINVTPRQVVGTSASLIPFIAHDEANRALMGTHMQCQAVPLLLPQSPIVGTGMEKEVARAMGQVVFARHGGKVTFVDANQVIVEVTAKEAEESKKILQANRNEISFKVKGNKEIYLINNFKRTAQSTCYSQKPIVTVGQQIRKGQAIIDGPASDQTELALGTNLTIAYMSYEGLGYEDAIVVSDRVVKEDLLSSIHIEEHEVEVVDTKLGPEEITRDIPNVSDEVLAHLDEEGIVTIGSEVSSGDILVGKVAPKGETELSAEERLLRAIFGEKAKEVKDTSLRLPHGEKGIVVEVRILDREKGDELNPGTNKKIIIKIAQLRKIVVGDKLAGRHGNKGVISKIVSEADMPHMEDGTPIDIIISPLSVLARMNLGQLLEAHLGLACQKLNKKLAIPVFEKIDEQKIINELIAANLPKSGKMTLINGKTGEKFDREIVVGVEYVMKLIHMVEDKTHARSTGPYSLVTQQPLGGKAQMGGQRLGEMEVWALEAHRASHVLQEMLTIKSDDVSGRAKAYESIVKGVILPESLVPASFKVLVKELQSLALAIDPVEAKVTSEDAEEVAKDENLKDEETKQLVVDQNDLSDLSIVEN